MPRDGRVFVFDHISLGVEDLGYYAAFVRDLDGHRLEAVLHES